MKTFDEWFETTLKGQDYPRSAIFLIRKVSKMAWDACNAEWEEKMEDMRRDREFSERD
jgi:hypothetical protein